MKKIYLCLLILSLTTYFTSCGNKENSKEIKSGDTADKDHTENNSGDIILFTEEQAQNVLNFKIDTLRKATFYQILKTSGQIMSAPGDEVQISATMSGIVTVSNPNLVEGFSVNAGQILFNISGKNLTENNASTRLIEAKAILENAKAEYERAEKLIVDKIISQKEYLQAKLAYEQANLNYRTFAEGMSGGGKSIDTPMKGFIKKPPDSVGAICGYGTNISHRYAKQTADFKG
ncbi:MAG: hypothetical protein ACLVKO_05800 [Dysgonomonas sp.]